MNRRLLIVTLLLSTTLAGAAAYLVLMKAPEGAQGPPENVPLGVVTKAGTLEQDETWSDAPEEINKFDVLGHANL